jgi:Undecaprenyl-phosphate galactose phosphotransferase WbaP
MAADAKELMSTNATFQNATVRTEYAVPHKSTRSRSDNLNYFTQLMKTCLPLVVSDAIAFALCVMLGGTLVAMLGLPAFVMTPQLLCAILGWVIVLFTAMGLYTSMGMHPIYEFRQCVNGVGLTFVFIASAIIQSGGSLTILTICPLMLAMIPLMRSATRQSLSRSSWWGVNCLVFACNRRVNRMFPVHLKNAPTGLRPVGFVQDNLPKGVAEEFRPFHLGPDSDANRLMRNQEAYVALVHRHGRSDQKIADFVDERLKGFSRVIIVPDDERLPSLWSMGKHSGILLEDRLLQPSSQFIKRASDIVISCGALILGFPLLMALAVWVKITSPGPLFYGHERIGRSGKRFKAWKFRSMCVNADEVLEKTLSENPELKAEWDATQKLQNDPRVSSSGRFLRKTSLDELPQLWNVIRGEMSLVGPRPIVASEVEKYDKTFGNYLRVTPGVTGFWQVSGRNLTTYDKRVELDDYYVKNWSLFFDLYILFRSIKTVVFREGAF